jgi:hypothetical protein
MADATGAGCPADTANARVTTETRAPGLVPPDADADPAAVAAYLTELLRSPETVRQIELRTTLSWGCPCPTWVFPFAEDVATIRYVMVVPAPGLARDPTDLATVSLSYRMTGRFTGERIDGLRWAAQRANAPPNFPGGGPSSPAAQEYWTETGLVFIVEAWCFVANGIEQDIRRLRASGASECPVQGMANPGRP